jgi:hypothetical protein
MRTTQRNEQPSARRKGWRGAIQLNRPSAIKVGLKRTICLARTEKLRETILHSPPEQLAGTPKNKSRASHRDKSVWRFFKFL